MNLLFKKLFSQLLLFSGIIGIPSRRPSRRPQSSRRKVLFRTRGQRRPTRSHRRPRSLVNTKQKSKKIEQLLS
jgi:hypothetical protein